MVDLLLWLVGDSVEEVSAYGNRIATQGSRYRYHDCVVALLKFKSGLIGKVTSNFGCVFPHFHALSVYGTQATFVNDFGNARLIDSRDPGKAFKTVSDSYPGIKKGDLLYSFVNSIVHGTKPEVSSEDVFKAMSVCFAIEKSVKKNAPIKVGTI